MTIYRNLKSLIVAASLLACTSNSLRAQYVPSDKPLFTTDITASSDGKIILSNKGTNTVDIFTPDFKNRVASITFDATPTGLEVKGDRLYVASFNSALGIGKLSIVNLADNTIIATNTVGSGTNTPTLSPDGKRLYVLNQFADQLVELDPESGAVKRSIKMLREPKGAVITPDGKYMFVTNFLPAQRADIDYVAADISIVDLESFTKIKDIKLANGSNALRGITITPDGKMVMVSHNLGRFQVPTSQLQQGWMNTSAMSIIDVETQTYAGAVVLDEPTRGAAGIWDIKATGDKIIVSHSGTHDLSVIDYKAFVDKLKNYKGDVEALSYDLRFLYGLRERVALTGNGPRNMALIADKLYIPTYFSDTLNIMSLSDNSLSIVPLVVNRNETKVQLGEKIFNDALYCFQQWQSCNGCHPGDARTDGMNWDLMNDGIGNSKNCKSLLYSHPTPPSMISGIRASAELAVRRGFQHIQFFEVPEEFAVATDEYLKSLQAVPSPYLENGELSAKAQRGRKVFEKLKCDECHSGPYYTDLQMHRIGEDVEFEKGWDTPTLREVWRTAPYLFDGRAATMREVFEVHKHGINRKMSSSELDELVEYVNSL